MISLAGLAALLARRYRITVTSVGATAYSRREDNGYVINIPAVMGDDPDSVAITNGYIDHEAGHVRFTDFDAMRGLSQFEATVLNIIEDNMIERKMAATYLGCGQHFATTAKTLFVDQHDPDADRALSKPALVMQWLLYHTRAHTHLCMRSLAQAYDAQLDNALPGLRAVLEPVTTADGVNACDCTADSVELMREIMSRLRQFVEFPPDEAEGATTELSSAINGDYFPDDASSIADVGKQMSKALSATVSQTLEETHTNPYDMDVRVWDKGTKDSGVAKPNIMPQTIARSALIAVAQLDAYLQMLVQHKRLAYDMPRRTGRRVDTHKLYRLSIGDPRIMESRAERQRVNTDVMIIADASGSMSGNDILVESKAVYAICNSLSHIAGTHTQAYAFYGDQIKPILGRDEAMSRGLFDISCPTGGTPLGSVYNRLLQNFDYSTDTKKLCILMTDGFIDDEAVFNAAYRLGNTLGVETIGVGICTSLPDTLPQDRQCIIKSVLDLPQALFSIIQGRLL